MPELPDITVYIEALERRIVGQPLEGVRLASPFLLRTVDPPIAAVRARRVRTLRRLGKRIAIGLGGRSLAGPAPDDRRPPALDATRREPASSLAGRHALAAFDFPNGTLTLTEAGAKKRASLHLVRGEAALGRARSGRPRGARRRISRRSAARSRARTTPSSARSPIRACSAASATPIRTRSCTGRGCRRSP